jgi:hypothetical protein
VEGVGEAWLDDVKITDTDSSKAVIVPEYQPQPAKLDPVVPMHGFWADYPASWLNFARSLKTMHRHKSRTFIFLGDSITQAGRYAERRSGRSDSLR